ncbi:MAG: hypothetical protein WC515_08420 [Candidatus Omnitrophota bacterium]
MRKIAFVTMFLTLFSCFNAYAAEGPTLLELRNEIFDESRAIKLLLPNSRKDLIFMNSMWDSCIATMMQIDAYFNMLGIFNTIKKESVTEDAVKYIADWLNTMKTTNTLTIKNLDAMSSKQIENNTRLHVQRMTEFYTGLNKRIDTELKGVLALKATAKKR